MTIDSTGRRCNCGNYGCLEAYASGPAIAARAIEGLETLDYLTSDTVWDIREQPPRLLVIGAGPIGCELAQAFSGLGTEVTLVTRASRVLPAEDEDVSAILTNSSTEYKSPDMFCRFLHTELFVCFD